MAPKRPPTSDSAVYARNPGVFSTRSADGTVTVMRMDLGDTFFRIDGLAAEIWNLIDGQLTLDDIEVILTKREAPPARFKKDMTEFVRTLKRKSLIRLVK